jgi:glycosidase
VKDHIFAVTRRWMDPNGDGNVSDGIDGMRLDVAEHIPLGFWRDFRKYVRSINPDFYLVGENWWKRWPDELMDATPWVKGEVFDAIMHYHWYKPTRAYINQGDDAISLEDYYSQIESVYAKYKPQSQHAMMNLISSHDTERALSSLYNLNKYKFNSKPSENKNYKTGKPDALAMNKFFVLLIQQFTFVGSPHIWNGDEMGMWGADDPDNRKPLWWPDIQFENETKLYDEQLSYDDKPEFNKNVFDFYSALIRLRKAEKALSLGTCEFDRTLIRNNIMAYKRMFENEELMVLINCEASQKEINLNQYKNFKPIYNYNAEFGETIVLKGFSGLVLKKLI